MDINVRFFNGKYAEIIVTETNASLCSGVLNEAEQKAYADKFYEAAQDLAPSDDLRSALRALIDSLEGLAEDPEVSQEVWRSHGMSDALDQAKALLP
jgi:hypothetical protein